MKTKEEIEKGLVFHGFDVKIECKNQNGGSWSTEFAGNFTGREDYEKAFVDAVSAEANVTIYDLDEVKEIIGGMLDEKQFEEASSLLGKVNKDGEVCFVVGFGHPDHKKYVSTEEAPDVYEVAWDYFAHDFQAVHSEISAEVTSRDFPDFSSIETDLDFENFTREDILDAVAQQLEHEQNEA